MIADRRLYGTLDGGVVEEDDPRADFLIIAEGQSLRDKDVAKYRLTQDDDGTVRYEGFTGPKPSTGVESLDLTAPGSGEGQPQPSQEPQEPEQTDGTELPDDFPGASDLRAAGRTTYEQVAELSEEDLKAVPGVGPATLEKIKVALNDWE